MLFSAFEKHQYYNLKDLVDITKQPVVRITCAHWALSTVLPREPGVLDGRGRWAGATAPLLMSGSISTFRRDVFMQLLLI